MKKSVKPPAVAEPDWAAIRKRYECLSVPITEVAEGTGMTWQRIAMHAKRAGWEMRKPRNAKEKEAAVESANIAPMRLSTRLKRLIAREIEAIESEDTAERPAADRERDARRLASLVRSLDKLNDLKANKAKRDEKADGEEGNDSGTDHRAELERRFARLVAAGATERLSREPEPGGDGLAD
tara:strand:+ start:199 stop:744 length:546 start_codon:yes stop_codon:yes gene_type:complete